MGTAPQTIANEVYQCLACPGTSPVTSCAGIPDTAPCVDGNACTQGNKCLAGVCVPGTPVTCTASDQCHGVGTCDTTTGICSNPALPDGTTCDDGDWLTTNDVCTSGKCLGTPVHGSQQLSGHITPAMAAAPLAGPLPGSTVIYLDVGFRLQTSEQVLADFVQQVSDPNSPNYRQYLTVDEFAAQFGALPTDYQAAQDSGDGPRPDCDQDLRQ